MAPQLPPKKDVAIALLQGPSIFVHIDPRKDGVVVPQWFKGKPQLVLQVGMNMAVPIHDLEVGDEGIGGTLSFSRQPHWCFMPWTAIYALVGEDQRGMIWPEDVPPELAAQQKRPALSVVDKSSKGPAPEGGEPDAGKSGETKLSKAKLSEAKLSEAKLSEAKRPRLAAVPSQPEQEAIETEPAKPSEEPIDEPDAAGTAEADDAAAPAPPDDDTSAPDDTTVPPKAEADDGKSDDGKAEGGKAEGKRELPPYLRVIK